MLNRHFKSIRQPNGLINKRWQNKWLTPETHTHTHTQPIQYFIPK